MKISFKLLSSVALATILAGSILAQAPQRGPQGGSPRGPGRMDPKRMAEFTARRVKEMKTALKLTSSQEKKVLSILTKSNKKMGALFTNSKLSRDERMKQFQAMRAKNDKAINAILSPSQRKLYKKWQAEHRMRRGGPGGPARPGRPQQAR